MIKLVRKFASGRLPARFRLPLLLTLAAGITSTLVGLEPAGAITASVTIQSGGLEFENGTPSNISFAPLNLDGNANQSTTGSLAFDVLDATGTAAGWNVQGTSTQFSDGAGHSLPTNSVTVATAPSASCDTSSACVAAVTNVNYPVTLPAGSGVGSTTIFNAIAGTGLGSETVTPTFKLTIPSTAVAASYSSIWTFSLVSGP